MKPNQLLSLLCATVFLFNCKGKNAANDVQNTVSKTRVQIIDPEALKILDSTAIVEVIAQGFKWTEGPLYIADGDYFIFSDIPENKIWKWKNGEVVSTYLKPSGNTGAPTKAKEPGSNGLLLNAEGSLVLCQHGDRRIAKMTAPINNPQPQFVTLADKYKGKRLNSPNDAVYRKNGDLYFTDPPYGLTNGITDSTKELSFQGVYRLKPNGELDLFTSELKYPNGIAFSPDEKFLYVSSSDPANFVWMQYELDENGLAKNQRVFYEAHSYEGKDLGAPDGMKINKEGYIFASGPEGIWLFNATGKLIARIYTGQKTANCALSPDEKMLLMTCDDYLMRLKLK